MVLGAYPNLISRRSAVPGPMESCGSVPDEDEPHATTITAPAPEEADDFGEYGLDAPAVPGERQQRQHHRDTVLGTGSCGREQELILRGRKGAVEAARIGSWEQESGSACLSQTPRRTGCMNGAA